MPNLKVALLRYCKTTAGWRRLRVQPVRKGRGWDELIDVPAGGIVTERGAYQIKWHVGGRAVYRPAGHNLQEAVTARDHQASVLQAEHFAAQASLELVSDCTQRVALASAKLTFVEKKRLAGRDHETVTAYEALITEFVTGCGKVFADQVTELDLLRFCDGLRKRGLAERTVKNYYASITTFLRSCGIDHKTVVSKENRPQKEDPEPEAYSDVEVREFLGACHSERDRLFFEFLLKTGVREKEAAFAEWVDIDWKENTITIHGEKNLQLSVSGQEKVVKFRTKSRRSRTITLEQWLLRNLQAWRKDNRDTRFVFGTSSDLPNGHFLDACKETARRAGLNCGQCRGCRQRNECGNFYLHKFRATFATWSLQGGVDIRTVQRLLGHSKIEMTARYLAPAKGKAAQAKLNTVFAGVSSPLVDAAGA